MNRLQNSCVIFVLSQMLFNGALANMKITPIAVDKSKSDLKVEEARYRDPVMPEYYNSYLDRNRQNFVTGGSYGGSSLSNYDRYGYNNNNNYDRYGSNYAYGGGSNPLAGSALGNALENKMNYLTGGLYGGNRYPDNRPPVAGPNGAYPIPPMQPPMPPHGGHGLLPPELEAKVGLLLPLAGAALLGIAAYAVITNPGIAMAAGPVAYGKRRKRSLGDYKVDQHMMAYRARHQN